MPPAWESVLMHIPVCVPLDGLIDSVQKWHKITACSMCDAVCVVWRAVKTHKTLNAMCVVRCDYGGWCMAVDGGCKRSVVIRRGDGDDSSSHCEKHTCLECRQLSLTPCPVGFPCSHDFRSRSTLQYPVRRQLRGMTMARSKCSTRLELGMEVWGHGPSKGGSTGRAKVRARAKQGRGTSQARAEVRPSCPPAAAPVGRPHRRHSVEAAILALALFLGQEIAGLP